MSDWSIIVPQITTNILVNASFEESLTGWEAIGGADANLDASDASHGYAHVRVNCYASQVGAGFRTVEVAFAADTVAVASAYVWGSGRAKLRILALDVDSLLVGTGESGEFQLGTEKVRYSLAWRTPATTTKVHFYLVNTLAQEAVIRVDAAQLEAGVLTTFCDGTQEGCVWNGRPYLSTSTRPANVRAGGVEKDLLDDFGVFVAEHSGLGYPTPINRTSEPGLGNGVTHEGSTFEAREIRLRCSFVGGQDALALLTARNPLSMAVAPDLVPWDQPVRLIYKGGSRDVEIKAHYQGGLEADLTTAALERAEVLFLCPDPLLYERAGQSVTLMPNDLLELSSVLIFDDGGWSIAGGPNTGPNGGVIRAILPLEDGRYVVGGTFTSLTNGGNNVANTGYIGVFDPTTNLYSAMGTGISTIAGGGVRALELGADNRVYVGGLFNNAGGVSGANNFARYNLLTGAWSLCGTGSAVNGEVHCLKLVEYSTIWLGGAFTDLGDAGGDRICKWAHETFISAWPGFNGLVRKIDLLPNGEVVAVGDFTALSDGSVANTAYIAVFRAWPYGAGWYSITTTAAASHALDSLAIGQDGKIYVGGDSTTSVDGVTGSRVFVYDGQRWAAVGQGLARVDYLLTLADGRIFAAGDTSTISGLTTTDKTVAWDGREWQPFGVKWSGAPIVIAATVRQGDSDLLIALDASVYASVGVVQTVNNLGSTDAYPSILVGRGDDPGAGSSETIPWARIEHFDNRSILETLFMSYPLARNDYITIDLSPEEKRVYTRRFGDVTGKAVRRGSRFHSWRLKGGLNELDVFVKPGVDPTISIFMKWIPCHLTVDGVA